MLQTVRVFAIAAIFGPTRWLHIGSFPRPGAERTERRCRVKRPRPHFHVIGLQDRATIFRPIVMERQDQSLKGTGGVQMCWQRSGHRAGLVIEMMARSNLSARQGQACCPSTPTIRHWNHPTVRYVKPVSPRFYCFAELYN